MSFLPANAPFLLFDTDQAGMPAKLFEGPVGEILCTDTADVPAAFAALDAAREKGLWAAGYCAYELGAMLEPGLHDLIRSADQPLMHFYLFSRCIPLSPNELQHWLARPAAYPQPRLERGDLNQSREEYVQAISHIQDEIAAGNVYQINYTLRQKVRAHGRPETLYNHLREGQPAGYRALVAFPETTLLSFSPELFLRRDGDRLTTRPMKGTLPRGMTRQEDVVLQKQLQTDEKCRAENLMIVDLLRNDLSRIALPETVQTDALFEVEQYRSVHQMTSEISANVCKDMPLLDIFSALFPCGSITGAPKIAAMRLIDQLEQTERGAYTGTIGWIAPNGDFAFNVAIRTLQLDPCGRGSFGLGSGIVWDSQAEAEFEECLLKGDFLNSGRLPELIETTRLDDKGDIWLAQEHLDRLSESARFFTYPFNRPEISQQLDFAASQHKPGKSGRLRLLLGAAGTTAISITSFKPSRPEQRGRVGISRYRVNSRDVYLHHKTRNRSLYERSFSEEAEPNDYWDVLFFNEQGRLTEGARHNVMLKLDGIFVTPPQHDGCLPGTWRQRLLKDPELKVQERSLSLEDLQRAESIFIFNSLQGLREVQLSLNAAATNLS